MSDKHIKRDFSGLHRNRFHHFIMENIEVLYERATDFVAKNSKDIEKAGKALAIGTAVYYTASVRRIFIVITNGKSYPLIYASP